MNQETPEAAKIDLPESESPYFRTELCALLNKYSMENGSDTPDFILRDYLYRCLEAFDKAANARREWYK